MNPINTATPPVVEPELWLTFIKSFGMLSLVVGILVIVLFLIKRFSVYGGTHPDKNLIKMLASFNLAPRERVVLLDVLGEKILIGVTSQKINCLAVIENNDDLVQVENKPIDGFSKLLKKAIKKDFSGDKSDDAHS